jgi:uncharacterized protein (DUF362 family)
MDPKDLSRRDFLKLIGAATAGAVVLRGAGLDLDEADAALPHLVVAKGGNTDTALMTSRAVAALGGMGRFVKPGYHVVIKPNIARAMPPQYATTTNPTVVATLVRLCRSAGAASVTVMDNPTSSTPATCYRVSGIKSAVEKAGGKMVVMSSFKYPKTSIPLGRKLKSWPLYSDILNADCLINVPIAKQHGSTRLTLGLKNNMGCTNNRGGMHSAGLHQPIADIASRLRPDLTIVDAVRILVAHGPGGGSLADVRRKNIVIASTDPVAADSYACTLFGRHGSDIGYIRAAANMGLGRMALNSFTIKKIYV